MAATATKSNGTAPPVLTTQVHVPEPDIRSVRLTLEGLTPLIQHRFSEKAKRQMREKQMGAARVRKEPKDPEQDFRDSLYVVPGREHLEDGAEGKYYHPLLAFKAAAIDACSFLPKDVTKVMMRGAFFIDAPSDFPTGSQEAGPILAFSTLSMREDIVRLGGTTTDLRYRGQFDGWSVTLDIRYNANLLTLDQLVHLFNTAGFSVGVGEWRPSSQSGGEYGRFVVTSGEKEEA